MENQIVCKVTERRRNDYQRFLERYGEHVIISDGAHVPKNDLLAIVSEVRHSPCPPLTGLKEGDFKICLLTNDIKFLEDDFILVRGIKCKVMGMETSVLKIKNVLYLKRV